MADAEQVARNTDAFNAAIFAVHQNPDGTTPVKLTDGKRYSVTPVGEVQAGTWYFGADCVNCGRRIAVFRDPADGSRPHSFTGTGELAVRCPFCGANGRYGAAQIENYQGPETASDAVPSATDDGGRAAAKGTDVSTGPFVAVASFCEKVLVEADGHTSLIRLLDTLQIGSPDGRFPGDEGAPDELPIALGLVVLLRSGDYVGDATVRIRYFGPSGAAVGEEDHPLTFQGGEQGNQIVGNITLGIKREGIAWTEVSIGGRILTRIPLRIEFLRPAQTPGE